MTLDQMTDEMIVQKLDTLDILIGRCRDMQMLKVYNECYQKLIGEQARRDVEREGE